MFLIILMKIVYVTVFMINPVVMNDSQLLLIKTKYFYKYDK